MSTCEKMISCFFKCLCGCPIVYYCLFVLCLFLRNINSVEYVNITNGQPASMRRNSVISAMENFEQWFFEQQNAREEEDGYLFNTRVPKKPFNKKSNLFSFETKNDDIEVDHFIHTVCILKKSLC